MNKLLVVLFRTETFQWRITRNKETGFTIVAYELGAWAHSVGVLGRGRGACDVGGASYLPCSAGLTGWADYAGVVTDQDGGAFDLGRGVCFDLDGAFDSVHVDLEEAFDDFEKAFDLGAVGDDLLDLGMDCGASGWVSCEVDVVGDAQEGIEGGSHWVEALYEGACWVVETWGSFDLGQYWGVDSDVAEVAAYQGTSGPCFWNKSGQDEPFR